MHKITEFSCAELLRQEVVKLWIIEIRKVDKAGTPHDMKWEVYASYVVEVDDSPVEYPEIIPRIARRIAALRREYRKAGIDIEYRIRLERQVEREETVAATEPWLLIGKEPSA